MSVHILPKLTVYLLLIYLLMGCTVSPQATSLEPTPTIPTTPSVPTSISDEMLPAYIDFIWPKNGETVSQDRLTVGITSVGQGIGLGIFGNHVGIPLNETEEYLIDRSTLFIDGQPVANDSLSYADGLLSAQVIDANGNHLGEQFVGPLYLSWTPSLSIGTHTAKYLLIMEDAEFEYEWSFTVVE